MNCREADTQAPRIGCGCEACYRTREAALDPRLLAICRGDTRRMVMSGASEHVHRYVTAYLLGRIEWAALHMTIIESLIKLADRQHEQLVKFARITPPVIMCKEKVGPFAAALKPE